MLNFIAICGLEVISETPGINHSSKRQFHFSLQVHLAISGVFQVTAVPVSLHFQKHNIGCSKTHDNKRAVLQENKTTWENTQKTGRKRNKTQDTFKKVKLNPLVEEHNSYYKHLSSR